uniref:ATP synthase F0 subunit 8 n=1 Tax=Eumorphobotys obscuralis TaxID=2078669 RepID=UPI0028FCB5D1|nr:ATP synthase F0 subunit 8 [Eumorphobotys obscuralis]WNB40514.1 ATP synthase F0 subunit 8 [Eumorphobotys obscuralis]
MPQMMPINWILSLFFFICIYIIFNIMNYYIFIILNKNNNNNNNKYKFLKNNINWKW